MFGLGVAGAQTRSAIRGSQRDQGMTTNGRPSSVLLARLPATPSGGGHAATAASSGAWAPPMPANGPAPGTTGGSSGWVTPAKAQEAKAAWT